MSPLLEVRNLVKTFDLRRFTLLPGAAAEKVHAVQNVSFQINAGEVLGLVGESGSGKTTIGRIVLRLEEPTSGQVRFKDQVISTLPSARFMPLRRQIQMVFQDSFSSLDPRMSVQSIVAEPLMLLTDLSPKDQADEVRRILREVGLSEKLLDRFRHQLSGGQQQRVNIARALVLEPEFMVLDEPVSSLDASIRGQVVNLLKRVREKFNLSYLLISHDLHTVRAICDRVAIMRKGRLLELGTVSQIFGSPAHPYTKLLLSSTLLAIGDASSNGSTAAHVRTRIRVSDLPDDSDTFALDEVEAGHFVVHQQSD